jgi:enamine deaminase RidA (YjgF/YER057c/UK114 family)
LAAVAGGGYFSAVGMLNLSGVTVTGSGDFNSNGTMDPGNVGYPGAPITFTPGVYNIGANGRGTLSFTPPGSPTIHVIVYVLFSNTLMLMSSDAQSATSTLFTGFSQAQTGTPYSTSSFANPTVLFISGQTGTAAGSTSSVEAGVFSPNGTGGFTLSGDQNIGGAISPVSVTGGTYSLASNGRVQVTNPAGTTPAMILYMVSPLMAYAMSTDAHAMIGDAEPQIGGPFSNASLSGTFAFGTINPFDATNALLAGATTYDGAGNSTGTFDIDENGFLSLDNTFTGTYMASANGRTVTPASGTIQRLLYIIFTGKAATFGDTSADTNPSLVVTEQ